jgi:hypothetical protein
MRSGWTVVALSSAVACGLAACRGSDNAAEPEPSAKPSEKSFQDMDHDERAAFMKGVVLPTMSAHFRKFDAEEFAKINCATCHGDGAKDKSFEMPNPKLPKLPADPAGFAKLAAEHPQAVEFMKGTVVPEMARMLGEPIYDPATGKGFGCFECHTKQ